MIGIGIRNGPGIDSSIRRWQCAHVEYEPVAHVVAGEPAERDIDPVGDAEHAQCFVQLQRVEEGRRVVAAPAVLDSAAQAVEDEGDQRARPVVPFRGGHPRQRAEQQDDVGGIDVVAYLARGLAARTDPSGLSGPGARSRSAVVQRGAGARVRVRVRVKPAESQPPEQQHQRQDETADAVDEECGEAMYASD